MSYDEDMLLENDLNPKKKSKHERIIDQLKDIEEFDYNDMAPTPTKQTESSFLPSSMLKDQKKKSKDDDYDNDDYDQDKWFGDLIGARNGISKTRKKIKSDLFDEYGITNKKKKKKKKKNKDGDFVDYKQEFEPEMALYKNLLVAQNKFTDSLQREYDAIKSVKSSARGVSKQMSDLIENITEARALSMQLVDKHVNVKKQIAELNIKQKEKFGKNAMDGENMSDYASSYLKQMLMDRNAILDPGGNATIEDYTDDDMANEINSFVSFDDEDDEGHSTDAYLKFENMNVTVYVVIRNQDIENYEFRVEDSEGNEIDDYPMPNHTKISVNRSTNVATDMFGIKYPIIWE